MHDADPLYHQPGLSQAVVLEGSIRHVLFLHAGRRLHLDQMPAPAAARQDIAAKQQVIRSECRLEKHRRAGSQRVVGERYHLQRWRQIRDERSFGVAGAGGTVYFLPLAHYPPGGVIRRRDQFGLIFLQPESLGAVQIAQVVTLGNEHL